MGGGWWVNEAVSVACVTCLLIKISGHKSAVTAASAQVFSHPEIPTPLLLLATSVTILSFNQPPYSLDQQGSLTTSNRHTGFAISLFIG